MSVRTAKEVVYEHARSAWADAQALPRTRIAIDNLPFDMPDNAPWARLTVRNVGSTQETLGERGHRRWQHLALLFISIFTPRGSGSGAADDLADAARRACQGRRLGGADDIVLLEARVREAPDPSDDSPWYSVVVEIPFYYRETS